jgi:large conductance mechanosensitive channel
MPTPFFNEFKKFIQRGNVIDLAVGVVIGGAFGKIVSSLVADMIMPPLSLLISGVNFTTWKLRIGGTDAAPVTMNYGNFLQALFDFTIVAFAIFALIKFVNTLRETLEKEKSETPASPPPPAPDVLLLTEIRDILKDRR